MDESLVLQYDWVFFLAGGGSAACLAYVFLSAFFRARAAHRAMQQEIIVAQTQSEVMRMLLPLARSAGLWVKSFWTRGKSGTVYDQIEDGVKRKISAAGTPHGLGPEEYIGFFPVWGVIGGMFGTFAHMAAPIFGMESYVFCFASLAMLLWRNWLTGTMRRRQTAIRRTLPFSLDILTLAMEAGLDFTAALARMATKLKGTDLGAEYSLLLHEIQLGKSRSDALRDFASRVDVVEVRTVAASLIQADELGAPIGPILRIQASQQRERRSQRAEETAMKAPVKMLLPLVAFIFPTTLLTLFGLMYLAFAG